MKNEFERLRLICIERGCFADIRINEAGDFDIFITQIDRSGGHAVFE